MLALVVLMVGAGFLITALQSRGAESALEKSLEKRIDNIVAALDASAGKLPLTESYAQVVDRLGQVKDLSPAIGKDEFLLTPGQFKFVADQGRLRIDKTIKALGGRSTLLAETRRAAKSVYIIVVGAPRDQASAATRRLVRTLVFAGLALGTLLGLGGWLMAGAALRPVRRMAEKAAQISAADLGQRVLHTEETDSDEKLRKMPAELAHLGNTLDDMLERLDDSFRRERAFVDDASHELRTPLAIVRGELELALLHPGNAEETHATLTSSLHQVTRLGVMADDLLVLARAGVNKRPPALIDAGAVTDSLLARLRPQIRTDLRVERERKGDEGGPPAVIRPADLERILTNLVTNAAKAARCVVRVSLSGGESTTTIVVADDGPGFAPDVLDRAFERFVVGSASRTGSGTGLGLAIVAALTEAADGTVIATNGGSLGGAEVTVVLPAVLPDAKTADRRD